MLNVSGISAYYGGIQALRDVSLRIDEGEIVSVLGANGAGKSTLLKCLSREMKVRRGEIRFDGKPLPAKSYSVVEGGTVIVPEGRQIFTKLTVWENLQIGCCLRRDRDGIARDLERVYAMFPRLKEREKQYGGLLSGGEQQMLAIARGLMARPRLMMLDEPSLGLAPIIVSQIMGILTEINKTGTTILLVEQNARKALSISHRVYLMNVGRIVREGDARELMSDGALMEAYLGT
ncbi:MAG: ABC transporter ATP-binding protein [Clostridia bacterium]|nr:ABC transporter ATP-binding protein [Clostridia bacterium]